VQSAVDTQHHLIVAHEVSNVGIDKGHLSSTAGMARNALKAEAIEVLADRGYFKSEEIAACEEAGIEASVSKPLTSNARAEGHFDRRDFVLRSGAQHIRLPGCRKPDLSHDNRGVPLGSTSLLDQRL
jgi:hypothetical protein